MTLVSLSNKERRTQELGFTNNQKHVIFFTYQGVHFNNNFVDKIYQNHFFKM